MGSLVGYKNPTLGDSSATWTGDTNILASDDADASITGNNTASLRAKTFALDLPDGIIIRGIEILIEGEGDQAAVGDRRLDVSLTLDGTTAAGTSKQFDLPQTTDGIVVGGGATDLWGITLGIDVIEANSANFGVFIVKNSVTGTVNIDHVVLRVYFDGGIRGEWDVNFDTKRITHKRLYFDYITGAGGTLPVIGDVLYNTVGFETARIVTVEDWSVLAFGTYSLGEEHEGVTWADTDTYEVCSSVPFDTEVNGGLSEADVGSAFTVTGGTGTRTGIIRHVFSEGSTGIMWWDPTGEGGTAFTGDETIQIAAQSRASVTAAETANAHTGVVDGTAYEPDRILINYDAETTSFESESGSKRLRDTLGFQHNMVVCDTSTGATGMVMEDREDQLVNTEGTLFLADVEGTFTNNNTLEACVEIDYDTEANGGFHDLIGAANELEGASSLATGTIRRIINNGDSGTLYVTGIAGGPFTPGELLRENTGDQTRGTMTTAAQRDRVGGALINGSATTATSAFFSSQALFSDLMDQFDELIALEDDNPAQPEVRDQGYKFLNAWKLPYTTARWLIKGAISQLGTVGGGDNDSIHTNYFHLGSLGDDANTNIYVEQSGSVIEQFWAAGTFEMLLRNKNKNLEVNAGAQTFYARLFGETYDFATVTAIGLRNPVGLNTANDSNNNTSEATINSTQIYHDVRWMFASHRLDFITGSGDIPAVEEVVFNVTRSEAAQVCKSPASATSGTDIHVASNGVDLTSAWVSTDTLDLLDAHDFDGQASQFVLGEAVENGGDTWNATVRFVQQYGATRGRIWVSGVTGTLANDETIQLDGGGTVRATANGAVVTAGTWTATLNAVPTADQTVTRDVGDGGGDQPYYAVGALATATVLQGYELSKFLARDDAGGTSDPGSVLFPDNTQVEGRLYQKANTLVSAADIKKKALLGEFAGGKWFLAPGVFIENMATADAQNYELIDANGVTRNPPDIQTISVGGLSTASGGDAVLVARRPHAVANGSDTLDFNNGSPDTIDFNGSGDFLDLGFEDTVDANGTTSITIAGTTSNDGTYAVAAVAAGLITLATSGSLTNELAHTTAEISADNINKDEFTDGTGNNLGDNDYVVTETIGADRPASGTLIITDATDGSEAPGYEDVYTYSSFSTSTFQVTPPLVRTYGATARAWVPPIRKNAVASTESQTFIFVAAFPVKVIVRKKGIVPFSQDLEVSASGLSATAVRTPDTIVE